MNRVYLIDSENVNDAWVDLLPVLECDDRIIVFYTDKSPHMCYQNVITLIKNEKEIQFIKCFEGNNALDFQLVSELGYMLRDLPECTYTIVSNDTGFDAIVKYWKKRDFHVNRIRGKECHGVAEKCKHQDMSDDEMPNQGEEIEQPLLGDTEELSVEEPLLEGTESLVKVLEQNGSQSAEEDAGCIIDILRVITLNKMALFHNALTCMLDQKLGDAVYSHIKEHRDFYMTCRGEYIQKKKERERCYIGLVLKHNGLQEEDAAELHKLLYNVPKKDLKSLNAVILKKYGRTVGPVYYSLLKKHLKVIAKL